MNDLCLGVHQAERFGLLGPNGAGVITSSCQNSSAVFALFSLEGVIDHTIVPIQSANMLQSLCLAALILESQSCNVECRQDNDSGDADRAYAAIERRCPGGWAECARQLSAGTRYAGLLPATGPPAGPSDRHRAPSPLRQAEGSLKALPSHGNDERASRHMTDLAPRSASCYGPPLERTCRTGCGSLFRLCHAICEARMCRSESSCTTGMGTFHMLRRRPVTYAPRFHCDPGKTCSIPDDAFMVCRRSMCPGKIAAMLHATAQPAEMGRPAGQYSGAIKRKLLDLGSLYPGS